MDPTQGPALGVASASVARFGKLPQLLVEAFRDAVHEAVAGVIAGFLDAGDAGLPDAEQLVRKADVVRRLLRSEPETTVYDSIRKSGDDARSVRRSSCVGWSRCSRDI